MHARGAGHRDNQKRMVGSGGGRHPGGGLYVLGEEVGSGRDRQCYENKQLMIGEGRTEKVTENYP